MSTLTYTLIRGHLEWVYGGEVISFTELKQSKYKMSVKEWTDIMNKARGEPDINVTSSIIQVVTLIYSFQFNEYDKNKIVLEKLKELMESVPNVPFPNNGICYNLDKSLMDCVDGSNIIMQYFEQWFGNKAAYPVEGCSVTQSNDLKKVGYLNNPKKWDKDTKFGLKRIELLQRLIDELS